MTTVDRKNGKCAPSQLLLIARACLYSMTTECADVVARTNAQDSKTAPYGTSARYHISLASYVYPHQDDPDEQKPPIAAARSKSLRDVCFLFFYLHIKRHCAFCCVTFTTLSKPRKKEKRKKTRHTLAPCGPSTF